MVSANIILGVANCAVHIIRPFPANKNQGVNRLRSTRTEVERAGSTPAMNRRPHSLGSHQEYPRGLSHLCRIPQNHSDARISRLPLAAAATSPPPLPPAPPSSPMGAPSGPDACTPGTNGTKFPFCDGSLSMDARLDDLVSRVNMSDIPYQLTARQSTRLDYLGLPSYCKSKGPYHAPQPPSDFYKADFDSL